MAYGFTITRKGMNLLAKLVAGDTLAITRVMVGSGKVPDGVDPSDLEDLIEPKALATSTTPVTRDTVVEFVVEYRNDMNGGLDESFFLNEYGVFVQDPDQGEILLYYANLGEFPEPVYQYIEGQGNIVVRRYPVSIVLSKELHITIDYNAGALLTPDDLESYFRSTQPTNHIATITQEFGYTPMFALYKTDGAFGSLPFGSGPFGGGPSRTAAAAYETGPGGRVDVYSTGAFAGNPRTVRHSKNQVAFVYDGCATNLLLKMH